MRWVAVALAATVLVGCEGGELPLDDYAPEPVDAVAAHWRIVVDDGLDDTEMHDVVESVEAWRGAVAASCPIVISVERATVGDDLPVEERTITVAMGSPPSAGWTQWAGTSGRVIMRRRTANTPGIRRAWRVLVRHELGHAFGLEHRDDGVMFGFPSSPITREDSDAFASRHCGA